MAGYTEDAYVDRIGLVVEELFFKVWAVISKRTGTLCRVSDLLGVGFEEAIGRYLELSRSDFSDWSDSDWAYAEREWSSIINGFARWVAGSEVCRGY